MKEILVLFLLVTGTAPAIWGGSSLLSIEKPQEVFVVNPSTNIAVSIQTSSATLRELTKHYTVIVDELASASGVNNPMLLLVNPSTSTVTAYVDTLTLGVNVTNVLIEFNIYRNPVMTSSGTAVARNCIQDDSVPVLQAYKLGTVSNYNKIVFNMVVSQNNSSGINPFDGVIKILPGNSLLFTADPNSNNRGVVITVIWREK